MSKSLYIIVTIVVLALSAAIIGWSFFGLGSSTKPAVTKKSTQTVSQKSLLPVDISNSKVISAKVIYSFSAAVLKEIKNGSSGQELVTSLTGDGIKASFLLDKNTKIVFVNAQKEETSASAQDLKAGQSIRITAQYDLEKKTWVTKKVSIKQQVASAATGSAQ